MKLSKKLIAFLKWETIASITNQINHTFYTTVIGSSEYDIDKEDYETSFEVLVVDKNTKYIPSMWHAGADNIVDFEFNGPGGGGWALTTREFAEEEALRTIRSMFSPGDCNFITWAFKNSPEVFIDDARYKVPGIAVKS